MAHTKITKLQRLHVDVATNTGIANPARSGRTFIVLDGDLTAALEAVRAAEVEHGGRLDTAERRGLRTIERRLEQAKPEYVTVTVTVTDHEPPEQANEPIIEQAAPSAELLAAVAETGAGLAARRERATARAAESAAAHAAMADVAAAQRAAMTTAQQHPDAQAPTIGELRAMTFDARRAAVIGMSPVARARLLAAMGRDEIESFLDDAVIGIGPNNDIDATFRTQILDRYAEIDPDKATAARAAADNHPMPATGISTIPIVRFTPVATSVDDGTHQHECSTPGCVAWEECTDVGSDDRCSRPDTGWIGGRFYCKDCAEDLPRPTELARVIRGLPPVRPVSLPVTPSP